METAEKGSRHFIFMVFHADIIKENKSRISITGTTVNTVL
jgi:hypothetical protein